MFAAACNAIVAVLATLLLSLVLPDLIFATMWAFAYAAAAIAYLVLCPTGLFCRLLGLCAAWAIRWRDFLCSVFRENP